MFSYVNILGIVDGFCYFETLYNGRKIRGNLYGDKIFWIGEKYPMFRDEQRELIINIKHKIKR